ncbi:hypothetical protein ACFLX3_05525 [Chloroflexota bacterium]
MFVTATVVANVILRPLGHSILGTVEIVELAVVPLVAFALGYTALNIPAHELFEEIYHEGGY